MNVHQVSIIDWVVVGLSGALFIASIAGGLYVVIASGTVSHVRQPTAAEFNRLWWARFFSQVLAALYAVAQLLRLQVLWGPNSEVIDGGYHPSAMCRAYIAIMYGLLEPAFLLLALFACVYSLQARTSATAATGAIPGPRGGSSSGPPDGIRTSDGGGGNSSRSSSGSARSHSIQTGAPQSPSTPSSAAASTSSSRPNFNIMLFALGFSLPTVAAQLVCALFTRMYELDYSTWLFRTLFSTFTSADGVEKGYCPSEPVPQPTPPEEPAGSAQATSPPPLPVNGTSTDTGLAGGEPPSAPTPGWDVGQRSTTSSCSFCLFPLLSTLISAGFAVCFLLVLWLITQRMRAVVINRRLRRRVRILQAVVSVFLCLGIATRGVTVLFLPFDPGFEALRLAHVVCMAVVIGTISYVLVLKPVYDAQAADRYLRQYALGQFIVAQEGPNTFALVPQGSHAESAACGVTVTNPLTIGSAHMASSGMASGPGVPAARAHATSGLLKPSSSVKGVHMRKGSGQEGIEVAAPQPRGTTTEAECFSPLVPR